MGYAVLHIEKGVKSDNTMSSHIEREHHPGNADETRTHLNKELIEFPEGVTNRTQAIRNRIKTSGVKRQVGKNQVQALRLIFSTSPDDMERIRQEGKLDEWCKDSIDWAKKEFGEKNVVSAVLHDDEKTPHIHITVVPIVSGERRKVKNKQLKEDPTKKKYRKKDINAPRLCADDVITKSKLIHYQDSYAEAMNKYGLERGIRGSEAKHISTPQYYRDLALKNKELEKDIEHLQDETQEVYYKMRNLYDMKDEARDKFISMDNYVANKEKEIDLIEKKLQIAEQKYEPYKGQEDLNMLCVLFPSLTERLHLAKLCQAVNLGIDAIKSLFKGETVTVNGDLYSPEYKQSFLVKDGKLKIHKDKEKPDKLKLFINGRDIIDWFKLKYQEFKQNVTIPVKQNVKSRGRGL